MTAMDGHHSLVSASGLPLLVAAALVLAPPMFSQVPPIPSPDLELQYTGKLFGYYRIEPGKPPSLKPVLDFPMPSSGMRPVLLLGMGDNFAPEFGASIQQEFLPFGKSDPANPPENWSPCMAPVDKTPPDRSAASHQYAAPEVLYKSSKRMPVLAECDNVTRFLMTAGYRAIVPGREDFIYSATWLRRIAILLHGASSGVDEKLDNPFLVEAQLDDRKRKTPSRLLQAVPPKTWAVKPKPIQNSEGKLFMLAANIRVNMGKNSCPLLFAYNLKGSSHPCSLEDNSITAEMDWFQRLQETLSAWTIEDSSVINNSHEIEDALNRRASGDAEYRKQLVLNQFTILDTLMKAYKCDDMTTTEIAPQLTPLNQHVATNLKQGIEAFMNETSYMVNEASGTLSLKSGSDAENRWPMLSNHTLSVSCTGPEVDAGQLDNNAQDFVRNEEAEKIIGSLAQGALHSLKVALATTATYPQGPILVDEKVRRDALGLFLNLIYLEQRDIGFTIAALPSGKHALIIGVAGQETMQQISKTNFSVQAVDQVLSQSESRPPNNNSQNAKQRGAEVQETQQSSGRDKQYDLKTGDPRFAVKAVLRSAWAARAIAAQHTPGYSLFDYVIVLAQMPPAEALELGARVRSDMQAAFHDSANPPPSIDLILSEAQSGHETPSQAFAINLGDVPPVLTPQDGSVISGGEMRRVASTAGVYDNSSKFTLSFPSKLALSRLVVNRNSGSDRDTSESSPATGLEPSPGTSGAHQSQTAKQENQACDLTVNSESLPQNTACLLKIQLDQVKLAPHTSGEKDLDALWDACETTGEDKKIYADRSCQNNVLMQQLLHLLERGSHADVVFLERRDFYFGDLEKGYADYDVCEQWLDHKFADDPPNRTFYGNYCRLRVALDRVLWKGDYSQRVMVDGTTLTGMLQTAAQQTDEEQTLLARDVHDAWLTSYGIVTGPAKNLVRSTSSVYSFSVPGVKQCNFASGASSNADPSAATSATYCVNGQAILADHAYSLVTSDHLAGDQLVYATLGALTKNNPRYEFPSMKLFLTTEIADQATKEGLPSVLTADEKAPIANNHYRIPPEENLARVETDHQDRSLVQLDFSKLVAGFTFFHPSLTDSELASDLSGVANTQAITPHSQELDLETASRLTFSLPDSSHPDSASLAKTLTFGLQNDAEYDRKVLGNLIGNPETVTYSLNSYTTGGFVQVPVDTKFAPHPHAFIVVAPYQYQRQMTGAYLDFPYLSAAGVANSQQQLSVHAPYAWGFSQRVGFRYVVESKTKWGPDSGSYGEVGPEYGDQNNVLSGLKLPQISSAAECSFVATQSIQTCVKNAYKAAGIALNGSSVLVPVPQTLHAGGIYWTMHLQKQLTAPKKSSVTFDSQGDSFVWPGATLTTQERYGITTNLAFNFPIFGNITLSPTYSSFFFENQGAPPQRTSLTAPTYTVVLKWYFVRDSAVPFRKQSLFNGPATASQTSTSKLK